MRFGPFFSKGKTCAALSILLLMVAFLSLYKSYLCDATPPETPQAQTELSLEGGPILISPEPDMQRALTEQTMILRAISEDVDSVNQSLGEITVILQEERRR
jgi:hypothetical protein